jgi:fluoride exporter
MPTAPDLGAVAELPADLVRPPTLLHARRRRADLRELAAIFLGGIVGALLRVWLGRRLATPAAQWPWATFAVNIGGALMLGWLITRLQERLPLSTFRRPLLGTGFCGAFTTFSTMQVEALGMVEHGHAWLAAVYLLGSVTAGYLAVWVATAATRRARRLW